MSGASKGDERAVGDVGLVGEGATAGIILVEDITVVLVYGFAACICAAISNEEPRCVRLPLVSMCKLAGTFCRCWGSLVLLF